MLRIYRLAFATSWLKSGMAGLRTSSISYPAYGPITYWEGGPPKAPVVLLIHGIGSSAQQDFVRLGPSLTRKYRVIAPDLPGFGRSHSARIVQSITAQTDFIKWFTASLGLERFYITGNSMGGWIAQNFALSEKNKVAGLILIAPAGCTIPKPEEGLFTPKTEQDIKRLMSHLFVTPPPLPQWYVKGWLKSLENRKFSSTAEIMISMMEGRELLDEKVSGIQCPTLILGANEDKIIPPETLHNIARSISSSNLKIFSPSGHLVLVEKFTPCRNEIFSWLETNK